jgi:hypothetical protein
VKGDGIKIEGAPGKPLHFCGLQIWGIVSTEAVKETPFELPFPIKALKSETGKEVMPE